MLVQPCCPSGNVLSRVERFYCGPEGVSLQDMGRAWLFRTGGAPHWKQFENRTVLPTFLGRVAIWQLCRIWRLEPGDEILMPAYNCGTEVDPFLVWGCKVTFYRVDEKARIDLSDLIRRKTARTKIVYVTHYFGWPQDLRGLAPWCRKEKIRLVEDCALALFSSGPDGLLGGRGDAAIFSPSKFLPVPDGGFLTLPKDAARPAGLVDPAFPQGWRKIITMLKRDAQHKLQKHGLYAMTQDLKERFQHKCLTVEDSGGQAGMPADYYFDKTLSESGMSRLSSSLLETMDEGHVVEQRRRNYIYFDKSFRLASGDRPLFDSLPPGVCPLFFPVLVKERGRWTEFLAGKGIVAHSWWAGKHRACSWEGFAEAEYLKRSVLVLPVDQSLSLAQKEFIVATVNQYSEKCGTLTKPAQGMTWRN